MDVGTGGCGSCQLGQDAEDGRRCHCSVLLVQ
jgi:hypothetical protein